MNSPEELRRRRTRRLQLRFGRLARAFAKREGTIAIEWEAARVAEHLTLLLDVAETEPTPEREDAA